MRRKYYSKEIIKDIHKSRDRITEKKIQWKSDLWII